MANLAYVIARQLRKDGINSELLMQENPPKGSDPLLFDPTLNGYPDWFHFYNTEKRTWKKDVVKKMQDKKYELIHAYVEMPIFALLSRRPYVAHIQGSDFRELAFSKSARGFLLRRAYKKAKAILFFQPDHLELFPKLNLKLGIFLPPPWNTSFFKPEGKVSNHNAGKLVVFHPANLEWRLKGNDILIRGFAQYVKDNPDSTLIIVDRGIDSQRTRQLINSLEIEEKVQFIKGPLNATQLLHYYNIADVVADQFILGSLGSISWEVFSCEKPLLASINETQYKKLYGEPPPVVNASSSQKISENLNYLTDKKTRSEIGRKSRNWIIKYHDPHLFSQKIQIIYNTIINGDDLTEVEDRLRKTTSSQ